MGAVSVADSSPSPKRFPEREERFGEGDENAVETAPAESPADRGCSTDDPVAEVGPLVRISMFWLGLTSIDAVVGCGGPVPGQVRRAREEPARRGRSLAIVGALQFPFSVAIQPTVGSISDYASTRWGRRKPFIVAGACSTSLFLIGIASANSLLAIAAFVTLLALSTNIARGPFQGYVPDLVPDKQVGLASAMVGLMQVLGNVLGFGLAAIANTQGTSGWRSSRSRRSSS